MKNKPSAVVLITGIILFLLLVLFAGGAVDSVRRGSGFLFVPSFTPSATSTSTPTETATATAVPTNTPTFTPTATFTATFTATTIPSATPTGVPTATVTPYPTFDVTALAGEIYSKITETAEAYFLLQTPSVTPTLPAAELITGLEMVNGIDGKRLSYIQNSRKTHVYGFWIDYSEVSNREYAACMQTGYCSVPGSRLLENRPYFSDGFYADHPVVNVTRSQAEAYCSWAGMQLTSLQDWYDSVNVLPSVSENIDRIESGPRRNDAENSNLIGNVWEWVASEIENESGIMVGGSWKTASQDVKILRSGRMNTERFADDVGFRCVLYVNGERHE